MRKLNLSVSSRLAFIAAIAASLVLPACSVHVDKSKDGEEKKVDIQTPVGGIHVNTQAEARDTGLPEYPGARRRQKETSGEEKSANVNISSGLFALKVVAIEYESDDPPEKLVSFYKNQLKKYGEVLECRTSGHGVAMPDHKDDSRGSRELKCDGDNSGKKLELKVGTEDNQHIVAIEPEGKGSKFALVRVQARGKDTI
jgi:hypothetical protein